MLTDRGIGGTGAASKGPQWSDRGIGGTGGASQPTRSADRGIGGTGIIGIITGFASVCLDGVEVHLDAVTPVYVNGNPETAQRSAGAVGRNHGGRSCRPPQRPAGHGPP